MPATMTYGPYTYSPYTGAGGQPVHSTVVTPGTMAVGGTTGLGAGGASALSKLIKHYNKAYQKAREANEARYQQLLDITGQTTGQRQADIRQAYGQQGANIAQQLARQGMAGTTVLPTMQMGVSRERESALNRLADQLQGTKLGIIERRQDKYPDLGILTSLASTMGQAAGPAGISGILGALGKLKF